NLRELFAADPQRAARLTFDAAGLHVDLSKNLVALEQLFAEKKDLNLRELFAADPQRAARLTFDAAGLHVDLSKNLV
ncbi:hypothetical protein HT105_25270, partial [Bacteroides fragilis]|nr:hypothetical protein [Bacteroides fragilis]